MCVCMHFHTMHFKKSVCLKQFLNAPFWLFTSASSCSLQQQYIPNLQFPFHLAEGHPQLIQHGSLQQVFLWCCTSHELKTKKLCFQLHNKLAFTCTTTTTTNRLLGGQKPNGNAWTNAQVQKTVEQYHHLLWVIWNLYWGNFFFFSWKSTTNAKHKQILVN